MLCLMFVPLARPIYSERAPCDAYNCAHIHVVLSLRLPTTPVFRKHAQHLIIRSFGARGARSAHSMQMPMCAFFYGTKIWRATQCGCSVVTVTCDARPIILPKVRWVFVVFYLPEIEQRFVHERLWRCVFKFTIYHLQVSLKVNEFRASLRQPGSLPDLICASGTDTAVQYIHGTTSVHAEGSLQDFTYVFAKEHCLTCGTSKHIMLEGSK